MKYAKIDDAKIKVFILILILVAIKHIRLSIGRLIICLMELTSITLQRLVNEQSEGRGFRIIRNIMSDMPDILIDTKIQIVHPEPF